MKKFLLLLSSMFVMQCSANDYIRDIEFDWMPEAAIWEQNIRDCRSAEYCRAETLFER
jgi:hypothetical protein